MRGRGSGAKLFRPRIFSFLPHTHLLHVIGGAEIRLVMKVVGIAGCL